MSERAQALEAIRARLRNLETTKRAADRAGWTPTALAYYVEDVTTLLGLVAAPPVGVSPQPDEADALEVRIDLRRPTPTWDEVRAYAKALAYVKAERDELQALAGAILRSVRDDAHGEQWTIRKFLDDRGVYNDNLSGSRRLVEEACKKVIGGYDSPPASLSPVEPTPLSERHLPPAVVMLVSAASAASGYLERLQPDLAARLWAGVQAVISTPDKTVEPKPLTGAELLDRFRQVEPAPPTPAPCVWRVTGGALGNWVAPSCIAESIPAPWGTERATACHLCGKPMEISQ